MLKEHRQLTAAGSNKIRQLTAEGHLSNLLVFFSPIKCVNNNFQIFVRCISDIRMVCITFGLSHDWAFVGPLFGKGFLGQSRVLNPLCIEI